MKVLAEATHRSICFFRLDKDGTFILPTKNTNKYGIYIPTKEELISNKRNEEEIKKELGIDYLIYNDLDKIISELKNVNKDIDNFEISMFL